MREIRVFSVACIIKEKPQKKKKKKKNRVVHVPIGFCPLYFTLSFVAKQIKIKKKL